MGALRCVPSGGFEPPAFGSSDRCPYRTGHDGMVDNLGIEPSGRCLQGSTAHLCVALGANARARTGSLPITSRLHDQSCCAGDVEAGSPGFEPGSTDSESAMLPV